MRQQGRGHAARQVRRRWGGLAVLVSIGLAVAALYPGWRVERASAQPQAPTVSVFPSPGSGVASPQTQIAMRGVPLSQLGAIEVSGSQTGAHLGQIVGDSDGDGGSFIPVQPFAPGETVTVTTSLNVLGGSGGTFRFQVATPAPQSPFGSRRVRWVRGGVWRFRSRRDLAPPAAEILHGAGAGGSADIFLTPQYGPVQNGLEILGPRGQLIWFNRMPRGAMASDLQVQRYRGQPALTWWQGYSDEGMGIGEDVVADTSYQPIEVVRAANGLSADLHEFQLTPSGAALITAYYPVYRNASAVHGSKREIVFDSVVQEIDVPTGLVLFQWDSLDHVPLTDSYQPLPAEGPKVGFRNPYDYFHVDSVELDGDGNLLISGRNTWTVYKVDVRTGAVLWRLGGKRSSFRFVGAAGFAFQHDVHSHAAGDRYVTVFDDGAGLPAVHGQSRALELILNFKRKTASVFKQWGHSPQLLSLFEGNTQQLPDLDEFVGWGQQPYFTEFDQRHRTVLDGRFVSNTASYRAYRFPWNAVPATPPAVATAASGHHTTVYVSWNGATGVSRWQVLEGSSADALHRVATARKTSFETAIRVPRAPYLSVQALNTSGQVLATSATVNAR